MPNLRTVPLMTLLLWIFVFWGGLLFFIVAASSLSCGPWLFIVVQASLDVARRHSSFGTWDPVNRLRCPAAYGILIPRPGTEPISTALEGGFSTIGPLGNILSLLFLANISPRQLRLYKERDGNLHVFSNEVWYSPLCSCATDFSNLKGKFCAWVCDCVYVCVCVCVWERERMKVSLETSGALLLPSRLGIQPTPVRFGCFLSPESLTLPG